MKSRTLSEIIADDIGIPFLMYIREHSSEYINKMLKKRFIEVQLSNHKRIGGIR